MAGEKRPFTALITLLTFIAWGVFFPSIAAGAVYPETADFGDVAVGSTSSIPLEIKNTTSSTVILYFKYEHYTCGFSLPPQETVLHPDKSIEVEITWTPAQDSEGSTCSDTLKVIYGLDLYETVLITGNAVPAGSNKDPNGTIVIGDCDTGVEDRVYDGRLISEWIGECTAGARNPCRLLRCISALTTELKKAGIITCQDKRAIQGCAAQVKLHQRSRPKVPLRVLNKRCMHHYRWLRGCCR